MKVLAVSVALVAALTIGLASSSATTKTGAKGTKGAVAAKHKPKHKLITTKEIKNGAVTTAKLANHAVTGAKIKNGAVNSSKLSSSLLHKLAGFVVLNPSSTQTITYGGAAVGTILKMASGATADPLEIQDSNGAAVFAVASDGSLTVDGALSSDGGAISTDGVGDLTVAGQFTSDGGAVATDGFGDLTITGQLSTDGGDITTSGVGDLTITGALSTDNGDISSDGSGNLTVNGDLTGYGTVNAEGSDPFGNALNVDGGGVSITGTNNDGNYLDIGSGTVVVDGSGNLTIAGTFTSADLVTAQNGLDITGGDLQIDGDVSHLTAGLGTAGNEPAIAAGPGDGTGGTCTVATGSSDVRGEITITSTGGDQTASDPICTLTFNTAYGSAPTVVLQAMNGAAAVTVGSDENPYVDTATLAGAGFSIVANGQQHIENGTYVFDYQVIG